MSRHQDKLRATWQAENRCLGCGSEDAELFNGGKVVGEPDKTHNNRSCAECRAKSEEIRKLLAKIEATRGTFMPPKKGGGS
jgi:hypothetical protein